MGWNYRIVRKTYTHPKGDVEYSYDIHEVYYDTNGLPDGMTMESVGPSGSEDEEDEPGTGVNGVRWCLEHMKEALDKPVIDYDTCKELPNDTIQNTSDLDNVGHT